MDPPTCLLGPGVRDFPSRSGFPPLPTTESPMPKDATLSTKKSALNYINGEKNFVYVSPAKKKAAKKAYNKAVKEYGKALCKEYIG